MYIKKKNLRGLILHEFNIFFFFFKNFANKVSEQNHLNGNRQSLRIDLEEIASSRNL